MLFETCVIDLGMMLKSNRLIHFVGPHREPLNYTDLHSAPARMCWARTQCLLVARSEPPNLDLPWAAL